MTYKEALRILSNKKFAHRTELTDSQLVAVRTAIKALRTLSK